MRTYIELLEDKLDNYKGKLYHAKKRLYDGRSYSKGRTQTPPPETDIEPEEI